MECPTCPEVTLGEVGDKVRRQLGARRYPLGGSLEITERCNLACRMCYINQPAGSREVNNQEMMLPQIKSILDQLRDAGCFSLLLTGGEPLLRPDFCDIWRYAKQQGLLVSLFTNGTLLTPRIADVLAEWRPVMIEISLYGATQETYEGVTRVPGSFKRCIRGIEHVLERGLRLNLKTVLTRTNRHEIESMKALAAQFDVPYRFDAVLFPRLDGTKSPTDQRLSPTEVVALDEEYPDRQEELNRFYQDFATAVARNEYVYSCLAGQRTFHINSSGKLSVCMMARRTAYNLLQGSFQEGWEYLGEVVNKKRIADSPCLTCEAQVMCHQCPGWSQLVHNDDETRVEYVCQIGRMRHERVLSSLETNLELEHELETVLG